MRLLLACVLVVGCGDDSARHIADAPATFSGCTTADCTSAAGTLDGLTWLLPCGAAIDAKTCDASVVSTMATVGGQPGLTYDVTIHVRGVVETKSYAGGGGITTGFWTVGGTAPYDGYNVYELAISEPAQTYYLNSGPSNVQVAQPIDYMQTIHAAAGATVTLSADPADGVEVKNVDANLAPVSITGTTVMQPYDGQFIEMDVAGIQPQ